MNFLELSIVSPELPQNSNFLELSIVSPDLPKTRVSLPYDLQKFSSLDLSMSKTKHLMPVKQ